MNEPCPDGDLPIWFDGEIVPLREARLSPVDHGVTVGDGVFETLLVVRGVPFAWRRHYERLRLSARGLAIDVPPSATLRDGAAALLDRLGLAAGRLRVTVTAGPGAPGSGRPAGPPVAFMVAVPMAPPAPFADVVVAPWTRNERDATAGLKTTSYAGNVRALAYAHERGASEALFENTAGNLCEATGSNVFLVEAGRLCTPPASSGCLLGVTRALLLELAPQVGIEACEEDRTVADLRAAGEAFLASTTRTVQPIRNVDGVPLRATGGPVSRRLADAFADLMARELDP